MRLKYLIVLMLFNLYGVFSLAQCGLYPIDLEEKVNQSKYIIEGKVIRQECFKSSKRNKIFTLNTIKVFKVFKGNIPKEVTIITAGGKLNHEMEVASSLLSLNTGQAGLFFLNEELNESYSGFKLYTVYASAQGFYRYNFALNQISDVFHNYSNLNNEFYDMLEKDFDLKVINEYENFNWVSDEGFNRLTVINNFAPTTINAGVGEQITINGFGFGNARESNNVVFKNSNDGGSTYIPAEAANYILWTDTKIVVEVPGRAGSGKIALELNGARTESSQILKVNYAIINTGSSSLVHAPKHVARNANKGYIWNFNQNFSNDSVAKENLLISFKKWRCTTFINWTIGDNTVINFSERDTVSVITFDEQNELPAGVLGLCYGYYSGCTEDDWYIEEQDLLFRVSNLWHFGDDVFPNYQYDFQSVALHELGHAHQLAHVIDPADLMHYSLLHGDQKRNIGAFNLEGAQWMINKSLEGELCNQKRMNLLDSELCTDEFFGYFNTLIYPNPFTSQLTIDFYLVKEEQLIINLFDVTGKLIINYKNEKAPKGSFSLNFDFENNNLSSGIYLLKVETGNQKMIKKLVHE